VTLLLMAMVPEVKLVAVQVVMEAMLSAMAAMASMSTMLTARGRVTRGRECGDGQRSGDDPERTQGGHDVSHSEWVFRMANERIGLMLETKRPAWPTCDQAGPSSRSA
jgi:hypothetical protein